MSPLSYFIKINMLLALAAVLLFSVRQLARFKTLRLPSFLQLQLGYTLIVMSLVAPLLFANWTGLELTKRSPETVSSIAATTATGSYKTVVSKNLSLSAPMVTSIKSVCLLSFIFGFLLFCLEIIRLNNLVNTFRALRKIGRVHVMLSSRETIPASCTLGLSSYIILPPSVLLDAQTVAHCIRHEIQHIRQKDTLWIYLLVFLQKSLLINPFVHLLITIIKNLQELTCDEKLVIHQKVVAREYAESLLKIATLNRAVSFATLAPSMLGRNKTTELKRRITAMTQITSIRKNLKISVVLFLIATALIGAGASYTRSADIEFKQPKTAIIAMELQDEHKVLARPLPTIPIGKMVVVIEGDKKNPKKRFVEGVPRSYMVLEKKIESTGYILNVATENVKGMPEPSEQVDFLHIPLERRYFVRFVEVVGGE